MLVDDLCRMALRKIGAIAAGSQMDAAEGGDTLLALRLLYTELVDGGAFGRMIDAWLPANSPDFTAYPWARITAEDLGATIVTLPTVISANYVWDWGRGCGCVPYGLTSTPLASDRRPVWDGAVVSVNDLTSGSRTLHFYDGATAQWINALAISLADEAPLSRAYGDGLACELAVRLSPEYGVEPMGAVTDGARRFRSNIIYRPASQRRPSAGVFV